MDINDLIQEGNSFHFYGSFQDEIDNIDIYLKWKAKCKRFLISNYPNDKFVDEFDEICDSHNEHYHHNELMGILEAIKELPGETERKKIPPKEGGTIININQTQIQSQEIAIHIFLDAIKDELTGTQLKELKKIVSEEPEPEKAKSKVIEKLKSFGENVLSNIVANVITNTTIWGGLM